MNALALPPRHCGTSADWYAIARRHLRGARTALDSARFVERSEGHRWQSRRGKWLRSAVAWLVLADEARAVARALRASERARETP
jgi:hypothetical protein